MLEKLACLNENYFESLMQMNRQQSFKKIMNLTSLKIVEALK